MADVSTRVLPKEFSDEREFQRRIAETINAILAGKTNNWGTVTLDASETSTELEDFRVGINTVVILMPMTANAATALANVYFDEPGDGSIVINHASSANNDQNFRYALIG